MLTLRQKSIGSLFDISPAYLFPAIIASDNPRPLKNCYSHICTTLYAEYENLWSETKFVRDVFHILNRLHLMLGTRHPDKKYCFLLTF